MEIVKLKPAAKDYIWGGTKLLGFGKEASGATIAETWELSFDPDSPSIIATGPNAGKPLCEVAEHDDIGVCADSFGKFPVLIKLIDSQQDLSVQVHPDDNYAEEHEHSFGKTEMWYIIDAEPGSGLYVGWKDDVDKETIVAKVEDGTILELMNFFPVKKGDSYFIPAGTVHAIGKGVTLIEIQQNSNITYRLYDYKRLGKDGKPRELHLQKALEVIDTEKYRQIDFPKPLIGMCPYFASYHYEIKESLQIKAKPDSYASITILDGQGTFAGIPFGKGDTFFIPARQEGLLIGACEFVLTESAFLR